MENYKGYKINQPGDPAPWGDTENALFKQIIDQKVETPSLVGKRGHVLVVNEGENGFEPEAMIVKIEDSISYVFWELPTYLRQLPLQIGTHDALKTIIEAINIQIHRLQFTDGLVNMQDTAIVWKDKNGINQADIYVDTAEGTELPNSLHITAEQDMEHECSKNSYWTFWEGSDNGVVWRTGRVSPGGAVSYSELARMVNGKFYSTEPDISSYDTDTNGKVLVPRDWVTQKIQESRTLFVKTQEEFEEALDAEINNIYIVSPGTLPIYLPSGSELVLQSKTLKIYGQPLAFVPGTDTMWFRQKTPGTGYLLEFYNEVRIVSPNLRTDTGVKLRFKNVRLADSGCNVTSSRIVEFESNRTDPTPEGLPCFSGDVINGHWDNTDQFDKVRTVSTESEFLQAMLDGVPNVFIDGKSFTSGMLEVTVETIPYSGRAMNFEGDNIHFINATSVIFTYTGGAEIGHPFGLFFVSAVAFSTPLVITDQSLHFRYIFRPGGGTCTFQPSVGKTCTYERNESVDTWIRGTKELWHNTVNTAAQLPYSNTSSRLVATNVQTAIDELEGSFQQIGVATRHADDSIQQYLTPAVPSVLNGSTRLCRATLPFNIYTADIQILGQPIDFISGNYVFKANVDGITRAYIYPMIAVKTTTFSRFPNTPEETFGRPLIHVTHITGNEWDEATAGTLTLDGVDLRYQTKSDNITLVLTNGATATQVQWNTPASGGGGSNKYVAVAIPSNNMIITSADKGKLFSKSAGSSSITVKFNDTGWNVGEWVDLVTINGTIQTELIDGSGLIGGATPITSSTGTARVFWDGYYLTQSQSRSSGSGSGTVTNTQNDFTTANNNKIPIVSGTKNLKTSSLSVTEISTRATLQSSKTEVVIKPGGTNPTTLKLGASSAQFNNLTDAEIDASDDQSAVTKGWVDANTYFNRSESGITTKNMGDDIQLFNQIGSNSNVTTMLYPGSIEVKSYSAGGGEASNTTIDISGTTIHQSLSETIGGVTSTSDIKIKIKDDGGSISHSDDETTFTDIITYQKLASTYKASLPNTSIASITQAKDIITKEYADANYSGGSANIYLNNQDVSGLTSFSGSNGQVYASIFVPYHDITVSKFWFISGSAVATRDELFIGVYDASFTLVTSASRNAIYENGLNFIDLTTPFKLNSGTQYFLAIRAELGALNVGFGTCISNAALCREVFSGTGLPASIASAGAGTKSPYIALDGVLA